MRRPTKIRCETCSGTPRLARDVRHLAHGQDVVRHVVLSKNSERTEYARRCEVSTPPAAAATRASAASSAGFAIIPGK